MRPRFSILSLLGATGYVAVALAAFMRPLSEWNDASCLVCSLVVLGFGVEAIVSPKHRSIFFRGFLLFSLSYFVVSAAVDVSYRKMQTEHPSPLWYANRLSPQMELSDAVQNYDQNLLTSLYAKHLDEGNNRQKLWRLPGALRRLLWFHFSIAIGLVGGYYAAWRYHVWERRTKHLSEAS